MKKFFAVFLAVSLLFSGCSAVLPPDENSPPQDSVLPFDENTQPQDGVTQPQEGPPPTGTDSTAPPPEIGPEGLPTPSL